MARRPAPTPIKLLRGDRPSRIPTGEPQPGEEPPTPPVDRDEEWRAEWDRVCEDLRVLGVGPYRTDQAALIALIDATRAYQRIAAVVLKAPPVVRDRNGEPAVPRILGDMRRASAEVSRWCSHFGLSPSTRSSVRLRMVGPAGTLAPTSDLLSPGTGRTARQLPL